MAIDIEAHINCASFTPEFSPVCAGCPNSTACYGDVDMAIRPTPKPVAPQVRHIRGVLTLRRTRSITIIIQKGNTP